MLSVQTPIRFKLHKQPSNEPLLAWYTNGYFCIYYPQTRYPRVDTVNMKGSLEKLLELVDDNTPVYQVDTVPVQVYHNYRMKELDRDDGKATKDQFITALVAHGAIKIQ